MPTRRQYLTAAATPGGLALLASTASADDATIPSHITADTEGIERYQPMFHGTYGPLNQMIGLFGWHATSDQWDYECYYYWLKYTHQESWRDWLPIGSHLLDHEPVIVVRDPDAGEITQVLYSGYHHLVAAIDDGVTLSSGVADEQTHVNLRIDPTYHHYYNSDKTEGILLSQQSGVEFGSWLDKRAAWFDRDIYANTSNTAVTDPSVLVDAERDTWWADGALDKNLALLWVALGLRNADDADSALRTEGWF